jgi:hypothetical protein
MEIGVTKVPRVAGIGSCRIMTPIGIIERQGALKVCHNDALWFTHSTRDILQKIQIITGQKAISDDEVLFVVDGIRKYRPQKHRPNIFAGVECFVVEVSTIKNLNYRGLEIHQWCLRDYLLKENVSVDAVTKILQMPPAERDLSFLPERLPCMLRNVIAEAVASKQTEESLRVDLTRIVETLNAPVIFVPHLNLPGAGDKMIPERTLLSGVLERFSEEYGTGFFDPAPHIEEFGVEAALRDLGHYSPAGEKMIAEKLSAAIQEQIRVPVA